ncbi:MAG: hypothetical protein FWG87_15125 [Defluviitaleaceae bacterium]|nr:hypothetical protein [Defluviitaleaceae bacterium]
MPRSIVGDGFIRPEITSLCVNGRCLPRIDERAYLGTDKSVPYEKPCRFWRGVRFAVRVFGVTFCRGVRLLWRFGLYDGYL